MNIAYDLTTIIAHLGLIVAYPISIWLLDVATANSPVMLIVANRLAMLLACGYVVIGLLTLLKSRRKIIADAGLLKIRSNGFYTVPEPGGKVDKIGRFLSDERLTHFNSVINRFLVEKK